MPSARTPRVSTLCTSSGALVCGSCAVADRPLARMRGLMGRRGLESGEGILLRPAPSIHTFFMRFAIDVLFLDADMRVLRVVEALRPWRARSCRGSRVVIEMPAGEAARRGVTVGERLELLGGEA